MLISSETMVIGAVLPLLAGIVLQLFAARLLSSRGKGVLALLCCLPALVSVAATYVRIQSGPIDFNAAPWDGPLSLVVHVDALSLMFAAIGTVLGSIVLLYSIGYMADDCAATRFYAFMLTFICGMVGMVYSANLFALYLCWEAMGLCSFSLVGFWYTQPQSVAGARKVLLVTHLAGYGLLAAILILFARTGSALWTDPAVAHAFTSGLYSVMLIALLAKSVQFPLHTWIPEAMNAPTPVSALLHAACYVKAGVYLAARMHCFTPWPNSWGIVMMSLGTVTMIVGVAYAMIQHDLKRMLAFHTVSQIGYIITGLGLGTPLGIAAGLLHCLNHSLFKGGLFLAAGSVQHSTGTRDMNELGGLARRMPRTSLVWLISVGSMMGVPFMSGFASKWLLYTAALQAGQVVPALVAWVVSVGTVFSCVKATSAVFLGPATKRTESAHEAPVSMVAALGLFGLGSVVLGVAPQLATNYVINPILPLMGLGCAQVSWFGLTPAAGSWWTTAGLLPAIVSAGFGVFLYMFAGMSRARNFAMEGNAVLVGASGGGGVGVFTGGESISGPGRLPASDFSVILKNSWAPFYRTVDVDRVYLGAWKKLQSISRILVRALAWIEKSILLGIAFSATVLFVVIYRFSPVALPQTVHAIETSLTPLSLGLAGAGAGLLLAAAAQNKHRRLLPLLTLSTTAAVAATWITQPVLRLALLEFASFAGLALVWRFASRRAAWIYAGAVVVSAASMIAGQIALAHGAFCFARALLMTSFALKLALVPLFFWLPAVAEAAPALVTGLIIAVVDIGAFGEFYLAAQAHPGLFAPRALWTGIALATSLIASLLMLTQRNIKRMLALSTVEDMGFLLFGVASATELGLRGALIGATVHALAKSLLFISISAPEADGRLSDASRGLASGYPFSAAGFLAGMLSVLGVPPVLGFAGRWRLYLVAANTSHGLLTGFILSSMFSLVAYVLCLTRVWWGPPENEAADTPSAEPLLLRFTVVVLIVLLLVAGLWPNGALALVGRFQ